MFSVQNQLSLLKHAITPSFVYCILLQSLHTLAPSISLPFILSIAIAQFMDLQENVKSFMANFHVSNVLLGQFCTILRIFISLEEAIWNLRQPIKTMKCDYTKDADNLFIIHTFNNEWASNKSIH